MNALANSTSRLRASLQKNPSRDSDGNLTSAGGTNYQWDAENCLVRVDLGSGNNKIYYTYDYMGRRCRKTVKASNDSTIVSDGKTIYEGWNLIAEYNLSGSTLTRQKVHYWGPDISGSLQGAGGVGGLVATRLDVGSTGTYYTGYDPMKKFVGTVRRHQPIMMNWFKAREPIRQERWRA